MKPEAREPEKESVLVCFALEEECAPFRKMLFGKEWVSILVTGIGQRNAETALRQFLTEKSPGSVMTCGFAGGLDPNLKKGEVVFFTEDASLRKRLIAARVRSAKIVCARRIAVRAVEKKELRASTGGDVVEMESEMIQSICREHGIPCATLRAISDTASEDLPLDFNELSKADMNMDYVKLGWAIAKAPWKIVALIKLQRRCQHAAKNLAEVLVKIIFR